MGSDDGARQLPEPAAGRQRLFLEDVEDAPAISPRVIASTRSSSLISAPRPTLISTALSFIAAKCSARIRWRFSEVSGIASTTQSASGRTSRHRPTGTTRSNPSTGRPLR